MGISTKYFKKETIDFIVKNYDKNISILDVGSGSGTYYDLLNPLGYNNLDGVEAFYPYIKKFDLQSKYKKLYIGDITKIEIDYSKYDLIIMGDVFEHIKKEDAKILVDNINTIDMIISIPFESEQGPINENLYEIHQQSDLNVFNFLENYTNFSPLCLRFDYGVFTTKKSDLIYIEDKERELPKEYFNYVNLNYEKNNIITL